MRKSVSRIFKFQFLTIQTGFNLLGICSILFGLVKSRADLIFGFGILFHCNTDANVVDNSWQTFFIVTRETRKKPWRCTTGQFVAIMDDASGLYAEPVKFQETSFALQLVKCITTALSAFLRWTYEKRYNIQRTLSMRVKEIMTFNTYTETPCSNKPKPYTYCSL